MRLLRELMIRHTKSQRIGGALALALPAADSATVWLEMSAPEKILYAESRDKSRKRLAYNLGVTMKRSCLESAIAAAMDASGHVYEEPNTEDCSPAYREAYASLHENGNSLTAHKCTKVSETRIPLFYLNRLN